METIYKKYANLLTNYCLSVKKGDRVLIKSTYLAEPLLQEFLIAINEAGGHPLLDIDIQGQHKIMMDTSEEHQLKWIAPHTKYAMENFECYINVRAPFNLREGGNVSIEKTKILKNARKEMMQTYRDRTAILDLKRSLCQFPTNASAQNAGMSLKEYENFVFNACKLFEDDPIQGWLDLGKAQQGIVDHLNKCEKVHYKGPNIDLKFSTKGRIWMNSDGRTNMPSGEVYTAPVDDSANGWVKFTYQSIYMGGEVDEVYLEVKDGEVVKWDAKSGKELLDKVFSMPGARRFGEAAIGTNAQIQKITKNILFDEKIGGSIHLAVGQAYQQCGGINESAVHWDMITDMKDGGEIYADDEMIYQNGVFIIN